MSWELQHSKDLNESQDRDHANEVPNLRTQSYPEVDADGRTQHVNWDDVHEKPQGPVPQCVVKCAADAPDKKHRKGDQKKWVTNQSSPQADQPYQDNDDK